ncbi:thioesterase domain protein [Natrialba magadii ATCC 43099]|uniref:Thioesterase domain protein n=1 Tax=Natrialba magadii (strain ATCC 43099 / DSM 3394 / CCM 3739 / CIP 104546 / IAM 13178 / JCM 8861 / NBRC 102185 / NCIMB 2190 / MS3) TaxID=547559 RepID=D3SXM7_NATMM|nr:thioesterase family protein [Natrialba magadii]ADD05976.1 thioesterase domain protein [Natrialba magadii ATCC 43099]ELY30515.1 thioesterase superfamily protein [Natrialba magadii ATCC 43099]
MSEKFTTEVPVRFRDLDPLDHVNNAVHATYIETARTEYLEAVLDIPQDEVSFVIANLELTYKRPITIDDEPVVALEVTELGESSCTMAYEIRTGDEVATTAETTMVQIDPETGRPAPIPDAIREQVREFEELGVPA